MKRRFFLKTGAATAVPFLLGGLPIHAFGRSLRLQALTGAATETDRVLVLVQLNGGNDGLNTVLPLDQYSNLSRARSNILIPDSSALLLEGATGLHPAMTGMHQLFQAQKLALVQGAGYPDPNFSHFRATDIWTSASDSSEYITTGWAGRYLDREYPGYPEGYPSSEHPDPLAITIGSVVSTTCQGPVVNMGLALSDPDAFTQLISGGMDETPNTPYGHELRFIRQTLLQTNQYITVIQAAAAKAQNLSPLYPAEGQNRLADQLRIVAQMIAGGLQTRIYVVNQGGFDTHANQVDSSDKTAGAHATLLRNVSDAIAAFQDDLRLLGVEDRVVGMTFSEFGRRIAANASNGTDHGAAAPLFVFGSQVNARLFGSNPEIPSSVAPNDNLPMQYDFRSVYSSLLMDWLGVGEETIREILFDDFQHIPLIKTGQPAPPPEALLLLSPEPNPFLGPLKIRFQTPGGRVQLRLFDAQGRTVALISDREFEAGEFVIDFEGHSLSPGAYYLRIQQGNAQQMASLIKH
jgi:uncharacterized protein (DUF1501 family)